MHLQDLAGFVPLDYMALAAISAMVRGNDSDLHQMTSRERLISVNDVTWNHCITVPHWFPCE